MKRDIVVLGASAGGVEAIKGLLSQLPQDFPASLFITIHTLPVGPSHLAGVLAAESALLVRFAEDRGKILPGYAYIAVPNLHLILKRGYIRNRFLPKENGTRPAIDPMFRSAALTYARRVIGVIMTGSMDDGTAGLGVIRDEGGLVIVQDPKDASFPDMPLSAIKNVNPDYIVPQSEIAPLLVRLVNQDLKEVNRPEEINPKEIPVDLTCPGCGGILHEYKDGKVSGYQCQIGHRYTAETMLDEQNTVVEASLWRILSILKEKEFIARMLAANARNALNSKIKPEYLETQARAAAEARKRLNIIIDELGPRLFPEITQKPL